MHYEQDRSAERIGKAVVILMMVVAIAFAGRKYILPYFQQKLVEQTSSQTHYKTKIRIAHDSFLGYAVLRSDQVKQELSSHGILLEFEDDGADYGSRFENLESGKIDMAVFTIDAYIKASATHSGSNPGSIVMIIDETSGADAVLAYKETIPSLKELNHRKARFVLTPDSPSETMARILKADFDLPDLPDDCFEPADGAEDVYRRLKRSSGAEREAFVLWEPYVSMALEDSTVHVLFDSSRVSGYIVDVLIANRKFLLEHADAVDTLLKAYFRAHYKYTSSDGMTDLLRADARINRQKLGKTQAQAIVDKIKWKNTLENYGHFGLLTQSTSLMNIEDMIRNITYVLVQTGAVRADPFQGNAAAIYYDKCLSGLMSSAFHPSKKLNVTQGNTPPDEKINEAKALTRLSKQQWETLMPVGQLRVEPISFGRGNASISIGSRHYLDELAQRLKSYPHYYLTIAGHTRNVGDRDANQMLARQRAESAAEYLVSKGLSEIRIRAYGAEPGSLSGAKAQSVTFELGQLPF